MSTRLFLGALSVSILMAGAALSQSTAPDQTAAPPGGNSNMGDGTGGGPSGTIGDPNGLGPGSAARSQPPNVAAPAANRPLVSKVDAVNVAACLAMPHRDMMSTSKCKALMSSRPELFTSNATAPGR